MLSAFRVALAALAAGAIALPAAAQTSATREAWNMPTSPFRIADDLYYVGTGGLGAYLIDTGEGLILIDGALPESVPQIEASILQLGFQLRDVKYILNSHAHFDHSGGLAELKEDTGAKMVAHEGDVSALEGGSYLGSERIAAMFAPKVKVDIVLKDQDVVELGGWELVLHHTPGHSRGCSSWGFEARDGETTHDALVFCSATVAANRITPPLQYEGIVEDYRKTFAKAKAMNVDMPLAPHPEFFGLLEKRDRIARDAPNPFVDPDAFQALITRLEADFEKLLAERTAAAATSPN